MEVCSLEMIYNINWQHIKQQLISYTRDRNVWGGWFLAGNQDNHQNFVPSLISKNLWLIFIGMKQKKVFFFMKKNWPILNIYVEIARIGSWVSRALMWLNLYGLGEFKKTQFFCVGHFEILTLRHLFKSVRVLLVSWSDKLST